MKTAFESDLKSKTFCASKSYTRLREKEIRLFDLKFYQNLFIVFATIGPTSSIFCSSSNVAFIKSSILALKAFSITFDKWEPTFLMPSE